MPIIRIRSCIAIAACLLSGLAAAVEAHVDAGHRLAAKAVDSLSNGIRYKYGGTDPDSGLDCSAFVGLLYRADGGGSLPRTAREISEVSEPVDAGDMKPGDLVFFRNRRRGIAHVGIYVGDMRFVHASRKHGAVYESRISEPYWKSRFDGARRLSDMLPAS